MGNEFINAAVANAVERAWAAVYVVVGGLGSAVITSVVAVVQGWRTRWAYMGLGSAITLVFVLCALLALVLIPNGAVATVVATATMLVIPVTLWVIGRFALKPVRAEVSHADILSHYYLLVVQLRDLITAPNVTSGQAKLWADELSEVRASLRKLGRTISHPTAGAFADEPDYAGLSDAARGAANANSMLPVLMQKWAAWGGHRKTPVID